MVLRDTLLEIFTGGIMMEDQFEDTYKEWIEADEE